MLTGLAGVCTLQARARDFEILVSSDSLGASSLGWAALALVTTGTAAVQGLGPHTATCAAGCRLAWQQPSTLDTDLQPVSCPENRVQES